MGIKKIFVDILYHSGIYKILDRAFDTNGIYIFCYHRLLDDNSEIIHHLGVTKSNFIRHIEYYKNEYEIITMDEVINLVNKGNIDKKYAVITFDDGYRDNYSTGYEIFKKYNIKPTIYLTASNIEYQKMLWTDEIDKLVLAIKGKRIRLKVHDRIFQHILNDNNDRLKLAEEIKEYLKNLELHKIREIISELSKILNLDLNHIYYTNMLRWKDIEKLKEAGVIFGGHTMNHCNLGVEPPERLEHEIIDSKRLIEEKTKVTMKHFAYPYGKECHSCKRAKEYLVNNYETAVSVIPGINIDNIDLYNLSRIVIDNVRVKTIKMRLLKEKILRLTKRKR